MIRIVIIIIILLLLLMINCDINSNSYEYGLPDNAYNIEKINHRWCYFSLDGNRYIFKNYAHNSAITLIGKDEKE